MHLFSSAHTVSPYRPVLHQVLVDVYSTYWSPCTGSPVSTRFLHAGLRCTGFRQMNTVRIVSDVPLVIPTADVPFPPTLTARHRTL